MRPVHTLASLPLACLLLSCEAARVITAERPEPSFIRVSLDGELASAEAPMAFHPGINTRTLTVETLDKHGELHPFSGTLKLRVRPGRLTVAPRVDVVDGTWTGDVSFAAPFGPTRIWFGDEGYDDVESGSLASFATGVSEPMYFAFPTIPEMQYVPEDTDLTGELSETNQLKGEYAELRVDDRQVVVTAVGTAGFWAADVTDGVAYGGHNALFIYTFSKPEGIVAGSRLSRLQGGNQEYLGSTQLSFPTYEAFEGETLDIPSAVSLSAADSCSVPALEGLEAAVVRLDVARIPDSFTASSEDYVDYLEYGQWPIELLDGGCTLYVDHTATTLVFDPVNMAGVEIGPIQGLLVQVFDKWILVPQEDEDLTLPEGAVLERRQASHFMGRLRPRTR
jgi:hypothetical protein